VAQLIVLVHAPVLGPGSWGPVAAELSAAGSRVAVPSLAGFTDAGPPYTPRLVRLAAEQADVGPRDDVVLVTHSGAGVFAPLLLEALAGRSATAVFVDAALPSGSPGAAVVDPGFLPFLRGLARDGAVPPWPYWWQEEDLAPLFPDEATRRALTAEAQPLPLAFYEETLPPLPEGWPPRRAAYLVFSEPYKEQTAEAARLGWPVLELPGGHLHMVVSPAEVASAITALAAGAGVGAAE
jgi:Alpha/beta hydrolase family